MACSRLHVIPKSVRLILVRDLRTEGLSPALTKHPRKDIRKSWRFGLCGTSPQLLHHTWYLDQEVNALIGTHPNGIPNSDAIQKNYEQPLENKSRNGSLPPSSRKNNQRHLRDVDAPREAGTDSENQPSTTLLDDFMTTLNALRATTLTIQLRRSADSRKNRSYADSTPCNKNFPKLVMI